MGSPTAPARALLSVHFVVIGGSIAGLATALALARAGHRVTVLEKRAEDAPHPAGGFRIVPNGSKLFARWGLEKQLADVSVDSRMIHMYTCASFSLRKSQCSYCVQMPRASI
jgi:salicylate hydroxylase